MNNLRLTKKLNTGISLIRTLMCFEVVLCHFWLIPPQNKLLLPFYVLKPLAVPVFLLISFLLTGNSFKNLSYDSGIKRLWRISWPLTGWAIIYWIIYYKAGFVNSAADFLWQIVTGHSPRINPSMWFQSVLLSLTVLFMLVFSRFSSSVSIKLSVLLGFTALALQYTGITFRLFGNMRYELCYPLGRFFEMLPYAVIGICLSHFKIYQTLKKHSFVTICISSLCFIVITALEQILPPILPGNFGYGGFALIIQSIAAVTIAYLFPFDNLPDFATKLIGYLTKYTLGIYCIHRLVEKLLITYFNGTFNFSVNSFTKCIIVYIMSYFVCYIIDKIPLKPFKMLVN